MDTMFLEWTLTPMCIYGLPAILFAFVFYNMKLPFSIGAMLAPAIGNERAKKLMPVVDVICLFALCTGMAASLGQGVLLLSGGIEDYSSGLLQSGMVLWFISTAVIVAMFIIAAATGVARGIRKLSKYKFRFIPDSGDPGAFVRPAGGPAGILKCRSCICDGGGLRQLCQPDHGSGLGHPPLRRPSAGDRRSLHGYFGGFVPNREKRKEDSLGGLEAQA